MQRILKLIATSVLLFPVGAQAELTRLGNDQAYENAGSLAQVAVRCNKPLTDEFMGSIEALMDAATVSNNQLLKDSFAGGVASANRIVDADGCDGVIKYIESEIYPGQQVFLNR